MQLLVCIYSFNIIEQIILCFHVLIQPLPQLLAHVSLGRRGERDTLAHRLSVSR